MAEDRFHHVCIGGHCDGLEFNLVVFTGCVKINYKNGFYVKSATTNIFGQAVWHWHENETKTKTEK